MRDTYKILSEVYENIYPVHTEAREVRQTPLSPDEYKILNQLYDFRYYTDSKAQVRRIKAAGELEVVVKYSDGSFVCMLDDSRGITKFEYPNFYELVQALIKPYKASAELFQQQTPKGPGSALGLQSGGQI